MSTTPAAWPDITSLQGVTPLTYEQANILLNQLVIARREAVDELDDAGAAEADAERAYRIEIAKAWGEAAGVSAERQAYVQAMTSGHRHARDIARSQVRTAQARIAQLKDEQIDLMHRGKWSQLIDAAGGTG
jgi:predicted RecB family endonuclease